MVNIGEYFIIITPIIITNQFIIINYKDCISQSTSCTMNLSVMIKGFKAKKGQIIGLYQAKKILDSDQRSHKRFVKLYL